jgi:hypothetical protein
MARLQAASLLGACFLASCSDGGKKASEIGTPSTGGAGGMGDGGGAGGSSSTADGGTGSVCRPTPPCPSGWFHYSDTVCSPPYLGSGPGCRPEGDGLCYQTCNTSSDCTDPLFPNCTGLTVFDGSDQGRTKYVCTSSVAVPACATNDPAPGEAGGNTGGAGVGGTTGAPGGAGGGTGGAGDGGATGALGGAGGGGATDTSAAFEVYPPEMRESVTAGYGKRTTVTITANVELTQLSVTLSSGSSIIGLTGQCPETLAAGQACTIEVVLCGAGDHSSAQASGSLLIRTGGDHSESVTVPISVSCYSV